VVEEGDGESSARKNALREPRMATCSSSLPRGEVVLERFADEDADAEP